MNAGSFRKWLGYSLLACICTYILLSLYVAAFPKTIVFTRKITQYYQWFALPGPFFREDRIRFVPHFYFSLKKKNEPWTEWRNVEKENFLAYHEKLFGYRNLKQSRYERFMARSFGKMMRAKPANPTSLTAFKELHDYLKQNYFPAETDSVQFLYLWENMKVDDAVMDTAFHIRYKSY